MGDVTDISDHPEFMRTHRHEEPIETNFDLDEEEELGRGAVAPAPTICVNCIYCADLRPFWQRWFQKPQARGLLCLAKPLQAMEHPVTGETTYTNSMFTTPSKGLSHSFERCEDINLYGHCHLHKNNGGGHRNLTVRVLRSSGSRPVANLHPQRAPSEV